MAKGMTKTQLVRAMAEKLELTNKQTATFFETLAETAVKETKKNGEFTIPDSASSSRQSVRPASAAIPRPARPSRSRPRPL